MFNNISLKHCIFIDLLPDRFAVQRKPLTRNYFLDSELRTSCTLSEFDDLAEYHK